MSKPSGSWNLFTVKAGDRRDGNHPRLAFLAHSHRNRLQEE